jgi:putative SOS response-associated peptidase YedK
MFRTAVEKRRCLVLADGFYEWQKTSGRKRPHRIILENEDPFAFAGIWSVWQDEHQAKVFSFSIITTEANPVVAEIHPRMPVILHPNDEQKWLTMPPEDATTLLKPYPASLMRTYEVSPEVNSPKNDSPEIIHPLQLRKRPYKMQKRPERRLDEFFKSS